MYVAKLFYGPLFGWTSQGKTYSTCYEMADSALKQVGAPTVPSAVI
jgi:hypothetical protein